MHFSFDYNFNFGGSPLGESAPLAVNPFRLVFYRQPGVALPSPQAALASRSFERVEGSATGTLVGDPIVIEQVIPSTANNDRITSFAYLDIANDNPNSIDAIQFNNTNLNGNNRNITGDLATYNDELNAVALYVTGDGMNRAASRTSALAQPSQIEVHFEDSPFPIEVPFWVVNPTEAFNTIESTRALIASTSGLSLTREETSSQRCVYIFNEDPTIAPTINITNVSAESQAPDSTPGNLPPNESPPGS